MTDLSGPGRTSSDAVDPVEHAGRPERIGDHVVLGRLGAGATSEVFEVEAPHGERLALKWLRRDAPGTRERARRERLALTSLDGQVVAVRQHPWLVRGVRRGAGHAAATATAVRLHCLDAAGDGLDVRWELELGPRIPSARPVCSCAPAAQAPPLLHPPAFHHTLEHHATGAAAAYRRSADVAAETRGPAQPLLPAILRDDPDEDRSDEALDEAEDTWIAARRPVESGGAVPAQPAELKKRRQATVGLAEVAEQLVVQAREAADDVRAEALRRRDVIAGEPAQRLLFFELLEVPLSPELYALACALRDAERGPGHQGAGG